MTSDQIISTLTEELKTKHGCHTVILYGSRARGDATEISDYDIMGIRAGGEAFRDARKWNGAYLDIFVYPESELQNPHTGLLDLRKGKILFQASDFATGLFAKLEEMYQAGPKKMRPDEVEALNVWHEKALDRIKAGGIQGNLRRAEFLPAILEHYFTMRGEWYLGPKAAFQWLKLNRPTLYAAFEEALEPTASYSKLATLVSLVNDYELVKHLK